MTALRSEPESPDLEANANNQPSTAQATTDALPTTDQPSEASLAEAPGGEAESLELTGLLERWSRGDQGARDTLVRRILPQLRRLAAKQLRGERRSHSLQATALVNEAFSKLLEQRVLRFECRGQFLAFAAELMRRILVDHARAHKALKRGAGQELLELDEALGFAPEKSDELISLDLALRDLARFHPEGAKVVELRYFVGLSHQEVAEALGVSRATARRVWTEARAWLFLQMQPDAVADESVDPRRS